MQNLRVYLNRLLTREAEKILRCYQKTFSPDHGMIRLGGELWRCRFFPTCSEYARLAIRQYGLINGSMLSLKRIFRCNPLFQGGYDPVK